MSDATLQAIQGLLGSTDDASLSLLRNRLAHLFFGTDYWIAWGTDYNQVWAGDFPDEPFGLLGVLRANGVLSDCDVPLALIYWTDSGIGFIDRWAVRRGLEPMARELGYPLVATSAHSLTRAVFCQFQEQVEELATRISSTPSLATSDLSLLFAYVPPVGVVPVLGQNSLGGFDLTSLFGTRASASPTIIPLVHVSGLFQKADSLPPVPVAPPVVPQTSPLSNVSGLVGTIGLSGTTLVTSGSKLLTRIPVTAATASAGLRPLSQLAQTVRPAATGLAVRPAATAFVPTGRPGSAIGATLNPVVGTATTPMLTIGIHGGHGPVVFPTPPVTQPPPPPVIAPTALTQSMQLYWVTENLQNNTGQQYAIFATRDLYGFLEKDDVVGTLHQAWRVYTALLKRATIMPKTASDVALPVWTAILTAQQSIIQFASTREAAAAAGALDGPAVVETFGVTDTLTGEVGGMYGLQEDLVQAASLTFDGDTGYSNRISLIASLRLYLEQTLPDGSPGLGPSIDQGDIAQIISAQQAINTLVGSWSDVVAIGAIQIQSGAAPQGTNLAPGNATPYTFQFAVTNRTDQRSVIATLTAVVLQADTLKPPAGNWAAALPIVDLAVPSAVPTDTLQLTLIQDASHPIAVQLVVPQVALGINLLIRVTATVAPPSNITSTGDKTGLQTSNANPNPSTSGLTVKLGSVLGSNPANATPGVNIRYVFNSQYVGGQGSPVPGQPQPPASLTNCTLTFTFTGTSVSSWSPSLPGGSQPGTPANTLKTQPFTLPAPATSGTQGVQPTILQLTPPARAATDQTVSFTVELDATYTDAQGNPQKLSDNAGGQTFSATVTHS